jgi:hypothetical protein
METRSSIPNAQSRLMCKCAQTIDNNRDLLSYFKINQKRVNSSATGVLTLAPLGRWTFRPRGHQPPSSN